MWPKFKALLQNKAAQTRRRGRRWLKMSWQMKNDVQNEMTEDKRVQNEHERERERENI